MQAALSFGASLTRGIGRILAASAGLIASLSTGGGHNFALTFAAGASLTATFTAVLQRIARLFSTGIARLPWTAGPARLLWSAARARLPWTSGKARND